MTARWSGRWSVVVVALVVAMAGCTGERSPEDRSPTPQLTPAEQRLQFEWHEQVEVPESALAVVEMARDWLYWYYLWDTEPLKIPRYLTEHTGEDLLWEIETAAGSGPPWMTGRVRLTLVEVDVDESVVTLGLCDDQRQQYRINDEGQPIIDGGDDVSGGRLELVRSGTGGWIADEHGWSADLEDRCDEPDVAPPLPTASPEWTGPPSTER